MLAKVTLCVTSLVMHTNVRNSDLMSNNVKKFTSNVSFAIIKLFYVLLTVHHVMILGK